MTAQTPEEIEADIVRHREQLAGTVDQITDKLDVRSRAQDKAAGIKDAATTADGGPRPEVLAAAGSLLAMAVVLVVWRLRRDR